MKSSRLTTFALAAALPVIMACQPAEAPEETVEAPAPAEEPAEEPMTEAVEEAAAPVSATASLAARDGSSLGLVTFTQEAEGVRVDANLGGIDTPGLHGFHIHETGDCSAEDFTSAGGHFNPESTEHACPPTIPRHAGDFGNVEIAEDGTGHLEATSALVTLEEGPTSIIGKAVIVHAGEDDCTTQPTGAAGDRIACGIIESAEAAMDAETAEDEGAY